MPEEKKKLGRFDIFNMGVSGAIGSGIFVLLGIGISFTGRSISLAVLVGCLYMLLAYLYQVVLSSMFVLQGGDYDAKLMLMNPTAVGINALFTLLNGMVLSAYALSVVEYAGMVFPNILPYKTILSVIIMTVFFLATVKGSKFVAILLNVMTVVLLTSLALFVFFGIGKVQPGYFTNEGFFLNGNIGFLQAIAYMGFACQGTTMGPLSVMSETKDARKIVPSTMLLITLTVGIVYSLMSIVASGVLPIEEVMGQNLAVVAEHIFPKPLFTVFILGGAVFAIATSMLGGIQILRFPCLRVAQDGWLPEVFTKQTKSGYPWVVMLMFYILSILPLVSSFNVSEIISLVMIPTMLFNVYLNIKLIKIVKEYPEQWKTSVLHINDTVFNILCVLSAVCAFMVAYFLFTGLNTNSMITSVIIIVVCIAFSVIQLKRGAVSKEELLEKRQEIAKKALEATLNE